MSARAALCSFIHGSHDSRAEGHLYFGLSRYWTWYLLLIFAIKHIMSFIITVISLSFAPPSSWAFHVLVSVGCLHRVCSVLWDVCCWCVFCIILNIRWPLTVPVSVVHCCPIYAAVTLTVLPALSVACDSVNQSCKPVLHFQYTHSHLKTWKKHVHPAG